MDVKLDPKARTCTAEPGKFGCRSVSIPHDSNGNVNPGGGGPLFVALQLDKSGSNTIYHAFSARAQAQGWPATSMCCEGELKHDPVCSVQKLESDGADCRFQPDGAVVLDSKFGFCEEVVNKSRPCKYIVLMRDPLDRLISAYNFFCVACHERGRQCGPGFGCPHLSLVEYAQKTGPYYMRQMYPEDRKRFQDRTRLSKVASPLAPNAIVRAIKEFLTPDKIAFASTLEHMGSTMPTLETLLASGGERKFSLGRAFKQRMNTFDREWAHPERRNDLAPMAVARRRVRSRPDLNQSETRVLTRILALDYELYREVAALEKW